MPFSPFSPAEDVEARVASRTKKSRGVTHKEIAWRHVQRAPQGRGGRAGKSLRRKGEGTLEPLDPLWDAPELDERRADLGSAARQGQVQRERNPYGRVKGRVKGRGGGRGEKCAAALGRAEGWRGREDGAAGAGAPRLACPISTG